MPLPPNLIRGHVILIILCAMGVAAAVMGVVQLWWAPMGGVIFAKSLGTIAILGVMTGFIAAVDIDMTAGRGRILMVALIVMAFIAGTLTIAQMWWQLIDGDHFVKIMITLAILAGLNAFVMAVHEDFGTSRKLKDDKYID